MNRILNQIRHRKWTRLFLVLILAYSVQVYPYVHFHHSHDESGPLFALNPHSTNIDGEGFLDRHDGVLHGHSLELSYDRPIARLQTKVQRLQQEVPHSCAAATTEANDEQKLTTLVSGTELIQKSSSTDQINYRGPPILA